MTVHEKYQDLIKQLPPKDCFNSFKLFEDKDVRVAVNNNGELNVLIPTGKFDNSNFSSINLSNIKILPSTICKVHEKNIILNDVFTILHFKNTDYQLQSYFLKVIHSVFNDLTNNPSVQDILNTIFYLVEIFRYISESPRKSILGLWGELFFIANSQETEFLLNIWHSDIYEYLDFSSPRIFYEIKSTTNDIRIHNFSLQQLEHNKEGYIISIITRPLTGGHSINDIIIIIESKINNPRLIAKMNQIVSQTLGREIINLKDKKFDYQLAIETIRFFHIGKIPKIKIQNIPREISDVKFKINLTDTEYEKINPW